MWLKILDSKVVAAIAGAAVASILAPIIVFNFFLVGEDPSISLLADFEEVGRDLYTTAMQPPSRVNQHRAYGVALADIRPRFFKVQKCLRPSERESAYNTFENFTQQIERAQAQSTKPGHGRDTWPEVELNLKELFETVTTKLRKASCLKYSTQ
jgi:hypothetical protein